MLRRLKRRRRHLLVALYVALLGLWAALVYDTYGVWLNRQETMAWQIARIVYRPTAVPEPTVDPTPATAEVVPTLTPMPLPTPQAARVTHPKTGRYIAAWLPTHFDADQARASFEANKDLLDEVSPFWYKVDPIYGHLIPEEGARDTGLVENARAANVLVIPTIHNVEDPEGVIPLLRDPARRRLHIAAIMNEVRQYNYDGIDIDYELLPVSIRPFYSDFIREVSDALHKEGKLLTVAVHAKSFDGGGLGAFQDWALLGEICDRIRIMTYDYHWMGGEAGPIAPLAWVSEVAEYARAVIPPAKIQIGIPFYAYNWAPGERALAQTWADVQQIIGAYQPKVNLQERDASGPVEESWFMYKPGRKWRTVWFASHRALEAKLKLIEREDLGGIAIWRLGNEDPQNWEVVREQLRRNPLVLQRSIDMYLPEH